MTRSISDLKDREKGTIALACIHLELSGVKEASKIVAKDYDVSPKGVTSLKDQALEAIRKHFSDTPSPTETTKTSSSPISQELRDRLGDLLGDGSTSKSEIIPESKSKRQRSKKLNSTELEAAYAEIEKVLSKIKSKNEEFSRKKSKNEDVNNLFLIYPGVDKLIEVSGQSRGVVKTWSDKHKKELDDHIDKMGMNKRTNQDIPPDVNLRDYLELS